jgi:hypothetical protein
MCRTTPARAFQVLVATSLLGALGLVAPDFMQGQSVMPGESAIVEWVLPAGVQMGPPAAPGFSETDRPYLGSSAADSLERESPLLNQSASADSVPGTQTSHRPAGTAPVDGDQALVAKSPAASLVRPHKRAQENS